MPPKNMNLRKMHADFTRQCLLDAARKLFLEKGSKATRIEEITDAAGTSRVTFYTYFSDKQDILRDMFSELAEISIQNFTAFSSLPNWSRESLRQWLETVFAIWKKHGLSSDLVHHEIPSDVSQMGPANIKRAIAGLMGDKEKWSHLDPTEAECRAYLLIYQVQQTVGSWTRKNWGAPKDLLLDTLTNVWVSTLTAPSIVKKKSSRRG